MPDALAANSANSLLRSLVAIVSESRKAEPKRLQALATKKFNEINQTHDSFLKILTRFRNDLRAARERMERTDERDAIVKAVARAIQTADKVRAVTRERRRAAYEE